MSVGTSRRARTGLVIALSALAGACTCPQTRIAPETPIVRAGVGLAALEQEPRHYKALAFPGTRTVKIDKIVPKIYLVTWGYGHKSTVITFDEKEIGRGNQPECSDNLGSCTWVIPQKLVEIEGKHKYKYTITGEYDEKTKLDPNDPWIEVDR